MNFFTRIPDEAPAQKARRLQKAAIGMKNDRLASLDWLRAVEHSMRAMCGKSWASFDNKKLLVGYTILENGSVRFPFQACVLLGVGVHATVVPSLRTQ